VTEQITGLDLVKEQIKVAQGEPLAFRQEDLTITGHALELRVYAEDPQNNFLPDIGRLSTYVRPQGPGVRVDDGFEQGMDIPIYYDPMIAKLVTTGATRQEAIERMLRAIAEFQITGIETTLPFGTFVLKHPAFVSGNFDTNFVRDHFSAAVLAPTTPDEGSAQVAAALVAMLLSEKKPAAAAVAGEAAGAAASGWRRNRLGVR
jgi:acetyl/propionyl-CoA carboxylase alpha subunit